MTTSVSDTVINVTSEDGSLATIWQAQRMQTAEWIAAESTACVVTFFALYIVTALSYYELKKRGWVISKKSDLSDYTTGEGSRNDSPLRSTNDSPNKGAFKVRRRRKPSHEERYETWLRALNLLAALYAMLKCFAIQLDMFLGTTTKQLCTGFAFTTVILNGSSFLCVYLLLWLRQWAVHSHPALQHLPVKMLRRLSWILLGAIIVTFVSLCVLFFVTIKVEQSYRGCVFADEGTVSQGARSGSGIIFTAIFQPALLALLCYPLVKHTLNRRRAFGIADNKGSATIGKPLDDNEAKIYGIIRRLVISVLLCTISDIGGVLCAFLLEEYPIFYIDLAYDVNVTFGAYVIVWSFNDWRQRMFPFCSRLRQKKSIKSSSATNPISCATNA